MERLTKCFLPASCFLLGCAGELDDGRGATNPAPSDPAVLDLRGPGSSDFEAHGGEGGAPLEVRTGVITAIGLRTGALVDQIAFRGYHPVHGDNIRRGEPLVETGPFGGPGGEDRGFQECQPGWAAIGLQGNASEYVERIGLICVNLQDARQVQTFPAVGGTGGTYFRDQCADDELMTGVDLRYGALIDSIKIYCQKR